jgi:hypothetical protein
MSLSADALAWNRTRLNPFHPPRSGHLESTFIKCHDLEGRHALWVKLTLFCPPQGGTGARAEAWAIAFDKDEAERIVAVKHQVDLSEARLVRMGGDPLEIAGTTFTGEHLRGEIFSGGSSVHFDLALTQIDPVPLALYPAALYRTPVPQTKQVSPVPDARAQGHVEVRTTHGSRRWQVQGWPAMQGHNWGTSHAHTYVWVHVNQWREPEGQGLILEGASARLKVGPFLTPEVSGLAVRHHGRTYAVRSPRDFAETRSTMEQHRLWKFRARMDGAFAEGEFALPERDTAGLYYPNPNGELTYCLNSKLAPVTLRWTPPGSRAVQLTSNCAAFEIGTRSPGHGVPMLL